MPRNNTATFETPQEVTQVIESTRPDLPANAARYEEMGWTDITPEAHDQARAILLQLPLVHRTGHQRFSGQRPEDESVIDVPAPKVMLSPDFEDNTYRLDHELDLDEYVFMGWGAPLSGDRNSFLGKNDYAVLVDSKLLLDERCVVTPKDIVEHLDSDILYDGIAKATTEDVNGISAYFRSMVSGTDWLEIVTRRVARAIQDGKPIELVLESFGEIKFKGAIPERAIIAGMDVRTEEYELYRKHVQEISDNTLQLIKQGTARRIANRLLNQY